MTRDYIDSWYGDLSCPDVVIPRESVILKLLVYQPDPSKALIGPDGKPLPKKHRIYPFARILKHNQTMWEEEDLNHKVALLTPQITQLKLTEQYIHWEHNHKDERPQVKPQPQKFRGMLIDWQERHLFLANPFNDPTGLELFMFEVPANMIRGLISYDTLIDMYLNRREQAVATTIPGNLGGIIASS